MDRLQTEARLKELTEGKAVKVNRLQAIQSAIELAEGEAAEKKPWIQLLNNDIQALEKKCADLKDEKDEIMPRLLANESRGSYVASLLLSSFMRKNAKLVREHEDLQILVPRDHNRVEEIDALTKDARAESEEKKKTAARFAVRISDLEEKIKVSGEEKDGLLRELRAIEEEIGKLSKELESAG